MEKKPVPFSPYAAIERLKGEHLSSGINWSYAAFETEALAKQFASECNMFNYRTRTLYQLTGQSNGARIPNGWWAIQYHHYED